MFDQELPECLALVRVVKGFLVADAGGAVGPDADEDALVVDCLRGAGQWGAWSCHSRRFGRGNVCASAFMGWRLTLIALRHLANLHISSRVLFFTTDHVGLLAMVT